MALNYLEEKYLVEEAMEVEIMVVVLWKSKLKYTVVYLTKLDIEATVFYIINQHYTLLR